MQIYKKMSEVMANIGSITKDQKNASQGFKFRGIDQFVNALHPALIKAGVFMSPRVIRSESEVREVERSSGKKGYDKTVNLLVEYDFYAEDGSKVTIGPIASEGLDSGDKATTKALSAALKYALIQTFSVPTEDMIDADSTSPELLTKSAPKINTFSSQAIQSTASKIEAIADKAEAPIVATPAKIVVPKPFVARKSATATASNSDGI